VNTLLATVIVLVLVGALAWVARRGQQLRGGGVGPTVESAVSLGERRSLVIVSVEGRRLLLGVTPASVSLVTELQPAPAQPEPAGPNA
jgi:flagellar biogenesis protein FliO